MTCEPTTSGSRNIEGEISWQLQPGNETDAAALFVDPSKDWDLQPVCVATFRGTGKCQKALQFTLYSTFFLCFLICFSCAVFFLMGALNCPQQRRLTASLSDTWTTAAQWWRTGSSGCGATSPVWLLSKTSLFGGTKETKPSSQLEKVGKVIYLSFLGRDHKM